MKVHNVFHVARAFFVLMWLSAIGSGNLCQYVCLCTAMLNIRPLTHLACWYQIRPSCTWNDNPAAGPSEEHLGAILNDFNLAAVAAVIAASIKTQIYEMRATFVTLKKKSALCAKRAYKFVQNPYGEAMKICGPAEVSCILYYNILILVTVRCASGTCVAIRNRIFRPLIHSTCGHRVCLHA